MKLIKSEVESLVEVLEVESGFQWDFFCIPLFLFIPFNFQIVIRFEREL